MTKAYRLRLDDSSIVHKELSVEEGVKIIISKTFPVDKNLKAKNILSSDDDCTVRVGAGFAIGNKIRFATERHLPTMRKIGVVVTRKYSRLAYAPYIDEPNQEEMEMGGPTGGMPRIDTIHLDNITLMLDEIGCDEEVFVKLWDLCFELFKIEIEMTTFDEMQFCTLKVLTKLLCAVKPREPVTPLAEKILNAGNNIARPEESYHEPNSKESIMKYGKSLHELLNSVDEYLLKLLPMKDFAESLNSGHVSTAKSTSRLQITVDSTYAKALFNGFMKSIEDAVALHKQYNPYLVKEMVKSLTLIISRNAELFMAEETTLSESTTSNQSYSFDWLYKFFASLYNEPLREEDWTMRQYLIYGMTKSFSIAYNTSQQIISSQPVSTSGNNSPSDKNTTNTYQTDMQVVFKAVQEALDDVHLRQYGFLSILTLIQHRMTPVINLLLPTLSERIQSWFLDEQQTVYVQLLQIRMVTSLVEFYPDSSTHNVTRKAMEALFNVIDRDSTSLRVINSIYDALQHLMVNYSLSAFERRLIEALTSFKKPQQRTKERTTSMSLIGKTLLSRLQLRASPEPSEKTVEKSPEKVVEKPPVDKSPEKSNVVALGTLLSNAQTKVAPIITKPTPEPSTPSMSRSSSVFSFLTGGTTTPRQGSTQPTPQTPAKTTSGFSLANVSAFFSGKKPVTAPVTPVAPPVETKQPETPARVTAPTPQPEEKNVHIHSRRVLLLSLMATSMYTSVNTAPSTVNNISNSDSNQEHKKVNVLQLFEQLHTTTDIHRESEMLLRFIPRLLEDFFDAEQILPLIFGEFLGNKTHPLLLSIVLRIHLPVAYHFEALSFVLAKANREAGIITDTNNEEILKRTASDILEDARKKSYHNSFGEWIKISLETLSLRHPPSRALWALLCVFITSCMCYDQHNRATLIEIGAAMPPEQDNPVFIHAFLLYGVRFDQCMKEHQTTVQRKTLVKVLQQMVETMDKSESHKQCWERTTVLALLSLLETTQE
jgi:hypothetical protein